MTTTYDLPSPKDIVADLPGESEGFHLAVHLAQRFGWAVRIITQGDIAEAWTNEMLDRHGRVISATAMPSEISGIVMATSEWASLGTISDEDWDLLNRAVSDAVDELASDRNNENWVIVAVDGQEGNPDPVYWSNDDGWGDLESATLFTVDDITVLDLPLGGAWIPRRRT